MPTITLTDGKDNGETLEAYDGETVNVEYDRELSAEEQTEATTRSSSMVNVQWLSKAHTVCLPYEITVDETASDYVAKTFRLVALDHDNKQFVFIDAPNIIPAGTPVVIVVYQGRLGLSAKRVKIDAKLPEGLPVYPTYADFLAQGDNYLGYWRGSFLDFRALFQAIEPSELDNYQLMYQPLDGDLQPFPADLFADPMPINPTGIKTTDFTDYTDKAASWYDLQGRKLSKKPTGKGVYIYNGNKVVIK